MPSKARSTTATAKLLAQWGFVQKAFTTRDLRNGKAPKGVSDETYGSRSFLYVSVGSPEQRRLMERKPHAEGIPVNRNYWPGSNTAEIRVSYFKGWHHNE